MHNQEAFLDCVNKDKVKEKWITSSDIDSSMVLLRNLQWPGFQSYIITYSKDIGYTYFGSGIKDKSILLYI